jgi:hypothetical protein
MSYAVVWSEDGGPVYAGKVELGQRSVLLAGRARPALESRRRLLYEELADLHVERRPAARLAGRPTLVLQRRHGGPVRIASVQGLGALHELAEALAAAHGKAAA